MGYHAGASDGVNPSDGDENDTFLGNGCFDVVE